MLKEDPYVGCMPPPVVAGPAAVGTLVGQGWPLVSLAERPCLMWLPWAAGGPGRLWWVAVVRPVVNGWELVGGEGQAPSTDRLEEGFQNAPANISTAEADHRTSCLGVSFSCGVPAASCFPWRLSKMSKPVWRRYLSFSCLSALGLGACKIFACTL